MKRAGVLPFARFMELALYCPEHGFYEKEKDSVGRHGDFYTSVSVGPLFGQLLAFQFAEWKKELAVEDCRWRIVEAGAHDGKLAADLLTWLRQQRPALFASVEYCVIEPSARRRQWQAGTLLEFEEKLRWVASVSHLSNPQSAIANRQFTVVFSNELLDAFPVHRLGWDAKQQGWFEWGVAWGRDQFCWTRLPDPFDVSRFTFYAPELLAVLPDGFTTEICPAAADWWRAAAGLVQHGKLLTVDYGFTAEEFSHPERREGTLRAYHRHRVSPDLLAHVGEQDLTAHVNFSELQSAGEAAGLKTEAFVTQAKFLTQIAGKIWQAPQTFGEWTAVHTRQFQTLTHPEHLGRPFKFLLQTRTP